MEELFFSQMVLPAGFSYKPDFISIEEEASLIDYISKIELHSFKFQGFEAKRRVASFGYDYSFEKRSIARGREFPVELSSLVEKVNGQPELEQGHFAELLITEYPVGSVINWHRDAPPFEIIAGISLLSDCTFRLRPHEKSRQGRKSILSIPLKRRSLYILRDSARNDWQHSIQPVASTRYSITLRTLRNDYQNIQRPY